MFQFLLDLEKEKSQPDNFVISTDRAPQMKISGTKGPQLQMCATLLDPRNLDFV